MKKNLLYILISIFTITTSQITHTINAGSYYYEPSEITISQGDIVEWINDGGFHDVNGASNSITDEPFNNPESFDSPSTSMVGATIYTHEFTIPGTYNYDCSVGTHALQGMTGSIIVNPIQEPTTTVVDIIVGSEDHNTLETAVIAAGLVDALSAEGPFTVFAPTDAAFDALPEGTLDAVLADMDLLTAILTHHVVSGSVLSTDLSDGMMAMTLNGTELMVSISDNGVMIDNAMVTVADIMADNGVVHVIDAVLIPENNSSINNYINTENDKYLYTIDLMGRFINNNNNNGIHIDVYQSGRSIKKLVNK
ncbi:MAG: hypothetical protein CMP54_03195 [Flavobacteriales bacterium]|nr:hypothetical protein [Flavobacteriales bacterium]